MNYMIIAHEIYLSLQPKLNISTLVANVVNESASGTATNKPNISLSLQPKLGIKYQLSTPINTTLSLQPKLNISTLVANVVNESASSSIST